jgi:4-hydroxy 2-oxovalerate aldolase
MWGETVDFDAVAAIVAQFESMQRIHGWGTNLPYMLSGAANLPQKEVMEWLGKNRYSTVAVIRALQKQSSAAVDRRKFPYLSAGHASGLGDSCLIIGGGGSVRTHLRAIRAFVRAREIGVIHANTRHLDLVSELGERQLVCLPGHTAARLPVDLSLHNVVAFIVPEPPRFVGTAPNDLPRPVFQATSYPPPTGDNLGPVSDIGPLALALGAARALSVKTIYLVGFDGYENATRAQQELASEIQRALNLMSNDAVNIISLTPTLYTVPTRSIYAELATSDNGGTPSKS